MKKPQKTPVVTIGQRIKAAPETDETLETFNGAFQWIKEQFVGRDAALEAIKLAMLCNEHVVFDGLHGVAKSSVADAAFSVVRDSIRFDRMLSPGSLAEEIVGPVALSKLRNEDRVHYNTERMLPEAHFAFLDEMFRAPDALLQMMMTILNERTFFNAGVRMRCPLVTAVATTNFVRRSEEMAAFNDRWLLWVRVDPVGNAGRLGLLRHSILNDGSAQLPDALKIDLSDLAEMQAAVRSVDVSSLVLRGIDTLIADFQAASEKAGMTKVEAYISDRRAIKLLRILRAQAFLLGKRSVDADALSALELALCRETAQINAYGSAMQICMNDLNFPTKEKEEFETVRQKVARSKKTIASLTDRQAAVRAYEVAMNGLNTWQGVDVTEWFPESRIIQAEFSALLADFSAFLQGVALKFDMKVKETVSSGDPTADDEADSDDNE